MKTTDETLDWIYLTNLKIGDRFSEAQAIKIMFDEIVRLRERISKLEEK